MCQIPNIRHYSRQILIFVKFRDRPRFYFSIATNHDFFFFCDHHIPKNHHTQEILWRQYEWSDSNFLDSHFVVCAHASVLPNITRLIDGPLALSTYFLIEFAMIRCNCGNYKISKLGDMLHRILVRFIVLLLIKNRKYTH